MGNKTGINNRTVTLGSVTLNLSAMSSGDDILDLSKPLPAGNQSAGFTNATGVAVMSSGHTVVSGTVDVYWTAGGVAYKRVGCTAVVAGNDVTLTEGTGTALPADGTTLIVTNQVSMAVAFDGTKLQEIVVTCDQVATALFETSAPATLLEADVKTAGSGYGWPDPVNPTTTPIDGTVATVTGSNGSTTPATLRFAVLLTT
jgi:hypothetical protein